MSTTATHPTSLAARVDRLERELARVQLALVLLLRKQAPSESDQPATLGVHARDGIATRDVFGNH